VAVKLERKATAGNQQT